jgi:putative hemolysin
MSALDQFLPAHQPYPVFPSLLPPSDVEQHRYRVTFASTRDDLDAVLRLRYDVFNRELGEGLDISLGTQRDFDEFDPVFHHLMVVDRPESTVVGTYRMQTSYMALRHRGFYSDGEFDLSTLPPHVIENAVEVGRTCIARPHRNSLVLLLLWKGLAGYLARTGTRYLFGCCSLPSLDPAQGRAALKAFERSGHMHPTIHVRPRPGWECDGPGGANDDAPVALPPLFRLYMRYGAKVCGPPALDRQFKTTDFLLLLDIAALGLNARRRLFDGPVQ